MNASALLVWLRSWATARTALGTITGGGVLLLIFELWISPWLEGNMGGERLLDLMPWRTPADVDAAFFVYSESGRAFYRRVLLVDLLFPLVYVPPLTLSVAFSAPMLRRLRRFAYILPLLPIAGGIFDWGENVLFLTQLRRFPDQGEFTSWIAFVMTLLKFAALGVSVAIIVWGLWLYRQESKEPSYRSNHHSR